MDKALLTKSVKEFIAGNQQSFEEIYAQTSSNLYVYAKFLMRDDEKAQDLLQNTYIEVINSIKGLKDPEAFLTWAKTIMLRQSKRMLASKELLLDTSGDEGASLFDGLRDEDRDYIPEERMDVAEIKSIIRNTIEALGPQTKAAMLAFYYEEMSISQIAEMTESSEAAVKSRLFKGRQATKERLEEYERKHGIKLHTILPIPAILLAFRDIDRNGLYALHQAKARTIFSNIMSEAGNQFVKANVSSMSGIKMSSSGIKMGGGIIGKNLLNGIVGKIVLGSFAFVVLVAGGIGISKLTNALEERGDVNLSQNSAHTEDVENADNARGEEAENVNETLGEEAVNAEQSVLAELQDGSYEIYFYENGIDIVGNEGSVVVDVLERQSFSDADIEKLRQGGSVSFDGMYVRSSTGEKTKLPSYVSSPYNKDIEQELKRLEEESKAGDEEKKRDMEIFKEFYSNRYFVTPEGFDETFVAVKGQENGQWGLWLDGESQALACVYEGVIHFNDKSVINIDFASDSSAIYGSSVKYVSINVKELKETIKGHELYKAYVKVSDNYVESMDLIVGADYSNTNNDNNAGPESIGDKAGVVEDGDYDFDIITSPITVDRDRIIVSASVSTPFSFTDEQVALLKAGQHVVFSDLYFNMNDNKIPVPPFVINDTDYASKSDYRVGESFHVRHEIVDGYNSLQYELEHQILKERVYQIVKFDGKETWSLAWEGWIVSARFDGNLVVDKDTQISVQEGIPDGSGWRIEHKSIDLEEFRKRLEASPFTYVEARGSVQDGKVVRLTLLREYRSTGE